MPDSHIGGAAHDLGIDPDQLVTILENYGIEKLVPTARRNSMKIRATVMEGILRELREARERVRHIETTAAREAAHLRSILNQVAAAMVEGTEAPRE